MSTPRRFRANVPAPVQDEAKPKLKRRKCLNCDKKFEVTKPNRKFCTTECKNEFGRHGSAFGPLKTHIETMMTRHTKQVRIELADLVKKLDAAMPLIQARFEAIEKFLEECEVETEPAAASAYSTPTARKFRRARA